MSGTGGLNYHYSNAAGGGAQIGDASLGGEIGGLLSTDLFNRVGTLITGVTIKWANGHTVESNYGLAFNHSIPRLTYDGGPSLDLISDGDYLLIADTGGGAICVSVVMANLPPLASHTDQIQIAFDKNSAETLFDTVAKAESTSGHIDYRCLYLQNDTGGDLTGILLTNNSTDPETSYRIALDPAAPATGGAGSSIEILDETDTADDLAGLTWATAGNPLTAFALTDGQSKALWIERTTPPGVINGPYCEGPIITTTYTG